MARLIPLLLLAAVLGNVASAETYLVRDINLASAGARASNLTDVGGTLFFVAHEPDGSAQVWKSDGSVAGTVRVGDVPTPREVRAAGSLFFFAVSNPDGSSALWRSDGTADGTIPLAQFSSGYGPRRLAAVGATLYFSASDATAGEELWKSDGTPAGTMRVADIFAGTSGSGPSELTSFNGALFFEAYDNAGGFGLWRSDGTAAGTVRVTGLPDPVNGSWWFTVVGGTRLFFKGNDSTLGQGLYRSDGTAAGTTRIAGGYYHGFLTDLNGTLFFTVYPALPGENELWKSDGTPGGTVAVSPGAPSNISNLRKVGNGLFVTANPPGGGADLWRSDGTGGGTQLLAHFDTSPIVPPIFTSAPNFLTDLAGTLLFRGFDTGAGIELWRSDGTAGGTVRVTDLVPGSASSNPIELAVSNGKLFFAAVDASGREGLWMSDGTSGGTVPLPGAGTDGSNPRALVDVGGTLFFSAFEPSGGFELWKSDGTTGGTTLVADLLPGAGGPTTGPLSLTSAIGRLFFRWVGATTRLFTSDGTAAGTVPLANLDTDSAFELVEAGGTAFFTNADRTLWRSDGTPGGTAQVADIPGPTYCTFFGCVTLESYPSELTDVGGTLFFRAVGYGDDELWKSDGTAAGTVEVTDIYQGYSASPSGLTNLNGVLLFAAADFPGGRELWRSDGSPAGTTRVADINPGGDDSSPVNLAVAGGTLFFSATEPVAGRELWRSDGTPAGTTRVADIVAGPGDSNPGNLTDLDGVLFFTAFDAAHGVELWKSDGTTPGTTRVADLAPGPASSDPSDLTAAHGFLFFSATEPDGGREVWVTDGAMLARVADIAPGSAGARPSGLVGSGGRLFFAAAAPSTGTELWATEVVCQPQGSCGNGVVDAGESCDEGAANGIGSCCSCDCTLADADDDGICDATDPCINLIPVAILGPKLSIRRLGTGDAISLKGKLGVPPSPPIDPLANGVRLAVTGANGQVLLDVTIPSGAYDPVLRQGWDVNGAATTWRYRSATGFQGIEKIRISGDPSSGALKFSARGKGGSYPLSASLLPPTVSFVVDVPIAATGQCGEVSFSSGDCRLTGATLGCR